MTSHQQNIVWRNQFSTVIKKTTTLSKCHFSCGYVINDPIQTNLPSWSWVLTKPLRSPSCKSRFKFSAKRRAPCDCSAFLLRAWEMYENKDVDVFQNVPVNVNTSLTERSIFCLQLQLTTLIYVATLDTKRQPDSFAVSLCSVFQQRRVSCVHLIPDFVQTSANHLVVA